MADSHDAPSDDTPLNERILDLLVYVPAGIVVAVAEELPKLAARGRDRLGVRVSSARAVGRFAVRAGTDELRRRSTGLFHGHGVGRSRDAAATRATAGPGPSVPPGTLAGNGHVPEVSTLSIPGFDSLSASQVVQRLDGLNRMELVSVRAYEASTRGRRTILSRVDQLLDERS
ncbi:MAG: hypothetical protein ABSF33_07710 [Acidimicrobiales bacterium]